MHDICFSESRALLLKLPSRDSCVRDGVSRASVLADAWRAVIIDSTRSVAKTLAASTMAFYDGDKPGGTPGMLTAVGEFNWWEAGAMFGQVCCRVGYFV